MKIVDMDREHPGTHHFYCPGCKEAHWFSTDGDHPARTADAPKTAPVWKWNGDRDKPTIWNSILVKHGSNGPRCHSMVTDGKIEFLGDSTHELSGKTVEIPEFEDLDEDGLTDMNCFKR